MFYVIVAAGGKRQAGRQQDRKIPALLPYFSGFDKRQTADEVSEREARYSRVD